METISYLFFGVAAIFYLRTWKYIRTLVRDVNEQSPGQHFSTLLWAKRRFAAWRLHAQLYPSSEVRKQIAFNAAMTMLFMLGTMFYQVRAFLIKHP